MAALAQVLESGGKGFGEAGVDFIDAREEGRGSALELFVHAVRGLFQHLAQVGVDVLQPCVEFARECHQLTADGDAGVFQHHAGGFGRLVDGAGERFRGAGERLGRLAAGVLDALDSAFCGGLQGLRPDPQGFADGFGDMVSGGDDVAGGGIGGGAHRLRGGSGGLADASGGAAGGFTDGACGLGSGGTDLFHGILGGCVQRLRRGFGGFGDAGGGGAGGFGDGIGAAVGGGGQLAAGGLHGAGHPFAQFLYLRAQQFLLFLQGGQRGFQGVGLIAQQGGHLVASVVQRGRHGFDAGRFLAQALECSGGVAGSLLQCAGDIAGGGAHALVHLQQAGGAGVGGFLQPVRVALQLLQHGQGFAMQGLADFGQHLALALQAAHEGVDAVLVVAEGALDAGQLLLRLHVYLAGLADGLLHAGEQLFHLLLQAFAELLCAFLFRRLATGAQQQDGVRQRIGNPAQLARALNDGGDTEGDDDGHEPHGGGDGDLLYAGGGGGVGQGGQCRQVDDGGQQRPHGGSAGGDQVWQRRGPLAHAGDMGRERGVVLVGRAGAQGWFRPRRGGGALFGGFPAGGLLLRLCHGGLASHAVCGCRGERACFAHATRPARAWQTSPHSCPDSNDIACARERASK